MTNLTTFNTLHSNKHTEQAVLTIFFHLRFLFRFIRMTLPNDTSETVLMKSNIPMHNYYNELSTTMFSAWACVKKWNVPQIFNQVTCHGDVQLQLNRVLTLTLDEGVSFTPLPFYLRGKPIPTTRRQEAGWVERKASPDTVAMRKNLPCQESKTGRPPRSTVTVGLLPESPRSRLKRDTT
jgi:hypothetical protein